MFPIETARVQIHPPQLLNYQQKKKKKFVTMNLVCSGDYLVILGLWYQCLSSDEWKYVLRLELINEYVSIVMKVR